MNKNIQILSGISEKFLEKTLTQDINCTECLLDLIDNSIDAARSSISKSVTHPKDENNLPSDYSGYQIDLSVSTKVLQIDDNCYGIASEIIENRLFMVGEESNQPYSIGHFGVGLKRALLKLGKKYLIDTCFDGDHYAIECNEKMITTPTRGSLIAQFKNSENKNSYTHIKIEELSDACLREIVQSPHWNQEMAKQIGIRYNIYIDKGLVITLNGKTIKSVCPNIKASSPVTIQRDCIVASDGVIVNIRAGMHEHYYPRDAPQYNPKVIESITEQYGWYYVCNDRVIKIASREAAFGWSKKWHQEYYGFVGWVYFIVS